jgi:hypothetical protein
MKLSMNKSHSTVFSILQEIEDASIKNKATDNRMSALQRVQQRAVVLQSQITAHPVNRH